MMNYGLGQAFMGGSQRDGAPQGGLAGAMMPSAPQQMMQQGQQKPGGLQAMLQGGMLGLLPMLLAGGNLDSFKGVGLSGLLGGGLGGLLGGGQK
jgi:hypothetical protein